MIARKRFGCLTSPPRLPEGGVYKAAHDGIKMKYTRPPRRLDRLFAATPVFFVTICTYRRRNFLANERVLAAFITFAECGESEFHIAVGRYVIMPDHLHFFVALPNDIDLGRWIGTLKRTLGKAMPPNDSCDPIWQRGFFDHVLRSDESYAEKWEYVRANPVRAGLVDDPDAWPFAGEIVVIDRS